MSDYLLDTNALSEAAKQVPNTGYMAWFEAADEISLHTSCLAIGEIEKGISLLSEGAKKRNYEVWLDKVIANFAGRVLGIDQEVASLWGKLVAVGQKSGKTPPAIDSLIAAQCISGNLTLVTRNAKDFEQFEALHVLNPWTD